ncbi:acetylglutamate kinase [bacterium]|nr:acetylglutamate kinase [bacterium]
MSKKDVVASHLLPEDVQDVAETLIEALPYMREFAEETFVIKYGGNAMGDEEVAKGFARDVVLLKQVGIDPVVVHGGGPQIGQMLERLRIQSSFVDGLRVTDRETVDIVEMVLCGSINKSIVAAIHNVGGKAVGLSGKDGNLIVAEKLRRTKKDPDSHIEQVLDLGFVGEPAKINPGVLEMFSGGDTIPVIAPIGFGKDGQTYNVNADTAAGAIAGALKASKLMMLTDVPGVLDQHKQLISKLTVKEAKALIAEGVATGGMIPKLETCMEAIAKGSQAAHILDGRIPHVVLVEIFTQHGVGTMIVP